MEQIIKKQNALETERMDFLKILCMFVEKIDFEEFEGKQFCGKPKINLRDLIKCLLIMNYNSLSYRRSCSEFEILKEQDFLNYIPKRSTLNKYMNSPIMIEILKKMIEVSALSFIEIEDCLLIDSSQFFDRIVFGGSKAKKLNKGRLFQVPTLAKTRKLHVAVGKNSKIIIYATTSLGTVHDHNFSKELIETPIKNGFKISCVLGDSAYNSRDNFSLCESYGIKAFFDFKKNHRLQRSGSKLRKEQFILYHKYKEIWHEAYRFRQIIEVVFSVIKKKGRPYLRSRTDVAKDCEMLLKALWYNLCIIAKHMDTI